MSAPIWPQIIYAIGDLPDGKYFAVVSERDFSYCRDLPDLPSIFEECWDEEDTEPTIHVEWDESHPRLANEALDKAS